MMCVQETTHVLSSGFFSLFSFCRINFLQIESVHSKHIYAKQVKYKNITKQCHYDNLFFVIFIFCFQNPDEIEL